MAVVPFHGSGIGLGAASALLDIEVLDIDAKLVTGAVEAVLCALLDFEVLDIEAKLATGAVDAVLSCDHESPFR